jgi:hypothetical protein
MDALMVEQIMFRRGVMRIGSPECWERRLQQFLEGRVLAPPQDVRERAGYILAVSIGLSSLFVESERAELEWLKALIKIGAKVVSHGRYVVFQMAEVAIPRQMFQEILWLIAELRPQPPPAPA